MPVPLRDDRREWKFYAPQILPASRGVAVRVQSVADPSKFATANLTITSTFAFQVNGPTTINASGSATIAATLTPVPASNPSQVLSWSIAGTGYNGTSCGTLVATTTQFDTNGAQVSSANYVSPATAPTPNTVTITVTPAADPSKKAQLTIAVQAEPSVSVSPVTATAAANHRVTLAAQIGSTTNTGVTWLVNGIAGGNKTVGQICVVASSPCQTVTSASTQQAVIAGTLGGWSCTSPGPAQFDGGYAIQALPAGHSYQIYAKALNGAVDPSREQCIDDALPKSYDGCGMANVVQLRGAAGEHRIYVASATVAISKFARKLSR